MLLRDDFVYKNVKCSDPLFEREHLDKYKRTKQGILQFTNSVVNRGDENKPFHRLLVYSNNTLKCRCRNANTRVSESVKNKNIPGTDDSKEGDADSSTQKKKMKHSSSQVKSDAPQGEVPRKRNKERGSNSAVFASNN